MVESRALAGKGLNLTDAEYRLYEKVHTHLKPQAPVPDLVVYLQAPVATLVERVHRRGVDYERAISEHYLARIADAYSRYFYQYEAAPLLIRAGAHASSRATCAATRGGTHESETKAALLRRSPKSTP